MGIDLAAIGTVDKSVCINANHMCTLQEYLDIAKKLIHKHAPKYLIKEMMSDDVVSYIAYAIMFGDWKYNGLGSIYGYRSQNAKFAIKVYQRRQRNKLKKEGRPISLDQTINNDNTATIGSLICNNDEAEYNNVFTGELLDLITKLTHSGVLSLKQSNYIIRHYYEGESIKDIYLSEGVTKQAVHQTIKNGLKAIKNNKTFNKLYNS